MIIFILLSTWYTLMFFCLFVCFPYLHYTSCTLYTYVLMSYLSPCCNLPKSIDSINSLYYFPCLVISSCLLSCKFIGLLNRCLRSLFVLWSFCSWWGGGHISYIISYHIIYHIIYRIINRGYTCTSLSLRHVWRLPSPKEFCRFRFRDYKSSK
jgi:hypothetical protein